MAAHSLAISCGRWSCSGLAVTGLMDCWPSPLIQRVWFAGEPQSQGKAGPAPRHARGGRVPCRSVRRSHPVASGPPCRADTWQKVDNFSTAVCAAGRPWAFNLRGALQTYDASPTVSVSANTPRSYSHHIGPAPADPRGPAEAAEHNQCAVAASGEKCGARGKFDGKA